MTEVNTLGVLLLLQGHHFQDLLTAMKLPQYFRRVAIFRESLLSELCAISFNIQLAL